MHKHIWEVSLQWEKYMENSDEASGNDDLVTVRQQTGRIKDSLKGGGGVVIRGALAHPKNFAWPSPLL